MADICVTYGYGCRYWRSLALLGCLALPLLAGCDRSRLPAGSERDGEGGAKRSAGSLGSAAPSSAPSSSGEWSLRLLRTLGEGSGEATFERIDAVAVSPDGRFYVMDGGEERISAFSPDGRFLAHLGSRGEGPGEFRTAAFVAWVEPGRLLVGERFPARLHWLSLEGEPLADARVTFSGRTTSGGARGVAEWGAGGGRLFVRIVELGPGGDAAPVGRLFEVDRAGVARTPLLTWRDPPRRAGLPELFAARWSWTVGLAGDPLVTPGNRYVVRRVVAAGTAPPLIDREVPPVPVPPAMREQELQRARDALRASGAPPSMSRQLLAGLRASSVLPSISRLWAGRPDGRVYAGVAGRGPDGRMRELGALDVYSPSGSPLGRLVLPPGVLPIRFRENVMYAEWRDEMDVPYLRIYGLRPPSG